MAQEKETRMFKHSVVTKMLIAELNRTTHALPKGEDQYDAQTYLSPAGRTVAKVMVCGTAIEKEDVGKDDSFWRMRIADPTGTAQVYAGTYQPESAQAIAQLDLPQFVAVVGKLSIYEPEGEGGNRIVSLRPDSISIIGGKTWDYFLLDAALSTLRSVKAVADEKMKEVAGIYGEKDGKDVYIFVAKQALESLLPTFSAEKLDQKAPERDATAQRCDDKVGEAKQDGAPSGQGITTTMPARPPKPNSIPQPAKASLSSDQKRGAPAYPRKAETKGKAGKEIDSSIRSVQEVVHEILKEKGTVKYEDLPELLKAKGGNPNMVDWSSAVSRLMQEGFCCEPRLGMLRLVIQ